MGKLLLFESAGEGNEAGGINGVGGTDWWEKRSIKGEIIDDEMGVEDGGIDAMKERLETNIPQITILSSSPLLLPHLHLNLVSLTYPISSYESHPLHHHLASPLLCLITIFFSATCTTIKRG